MQPAKNIRNLINEPLGQVLVKRGILTQSELDKALEIQKQRNNVYLGEILQQLGIKQNKINETLDYLNKRKKIGDILIDLGLITPESLERALKDQKLIQSKMGARRPLGILLFEMGLINFRDYMTALSKHFVLPIVSLEGRRIPPSIQDVLGRKYVCKNEVLILENDGRTLKIVLGAPTTFLMQEIRKSIPLQKEIIFYLAHPVEIEAAYKMMYDPFSENRDR
jgi:type IV pilus assembly protein PilB